MPAYVIVDVDIKDQVRYEEYKKLAVKTLAPFGGKYIVRGGKTEVLEGGRRPRRVVVLEFPNAQRAKEWWESDAYRPARTLRQSCAGTEMFVVEGA
jgi:uncharacterized protein (DUF1330 family)